MFLSNKSETNFFYVQVALPLNQFICRKCPNASHIVIDDLPQTKSFLDCLNALKVNCCPQLRWVSIMGWDFSWENIQNPAVVELCTANPPLFNIARITPKHVILAHHIIYLCHKMMIPPAFVAMHAWFVLLSVEGTLVIICFVCCLHCLGDVICC